MKKGGSREVEWILWDFKLINWYLIDKMIYWYDDILIVIISFLIWGYIDNFCGFVNIYIILIFFMGYV